MSDEIKSCPCGNVGYYVVPDLYTGEPMQEQCEFCYTEPNSVFNVVTALRTRVETLEAALKEIAHDDEHYPSTYDDLLSIARRALEEAK